MFNYIAVFGIFISLITYYAQDKYLDVGAYGKIGIMLVFLVFLAIYILQEIRYFIKNKKIRANTDRQYINFIKAWLSHPGDVAILSYGLSVSKNEEVFDILKNLVKERRLNIAMHSENINSKELRNLGANVYYYEKLDFIPSSRFTIVRYRQDDAKVAIDWEKPKTTI
ncbi:MAG: hypothetical protein HC850_00690 [Rhodomicrobium sp.]|nr:hypothetical protein [Rhodomicrobium sp.]